MYYVLIVAPSDTDAIDSRTMLMGSTSVGQRRVSHLGGVFLDKPWVCLNRRMGSRYWD